MQLPNNLIGWQPFEWCRIKTEFKSCFHIREIDFSCFRLLWITFTWMISLLVEKKNTELFAKEQSEQCSEYRQFWAGDIAINTSIYQYFLHYDSTWIIRLSCSGGNALLMWFSVIIVPFVGHFMLFFIEIHAKRIHVGFYLCWKFCHFMNIISFGMIEVAFFSKNITCILSFYNFNQAVYVIFSHSHQYFSK